MPDVTPAGPVAVALSGLRTLIANVSYFRTLVSAGTEAEALAHVFTGEVGWPIKAMSITNGIAMFTTREPTSIAVGNTVTIVGASLQDESQNQGGNSSVLSTPSSTVFTLNASGADDLAEVYPDGAFVFVGTRPIVVLSESDDALQSDSIGTGGASVYRGSMDILLESDISAAAYENDPVNALCEARSIFGQFVQGIATTQGTGDYICLNSITTVSGPEFVTRAEQDYNAVRFEAWRAVVRVTWGLS